MNEPKRTPCTITRSYFQAEARPVAVLLIKDLTPDQLQQLKMLLPGQVLALENMAPREFSTKSLGWNASAKAEFDLTPSTPVKCQLGVNLTIANSKEAA